MFIVGDLKYSFGSAPADAPEVDPLPGKTVILHYPGETAGLPSRGFLRGWVAYMKTNDTVHLQIWRPENKQFKLIHDTKLIVCLYYNCYVSFQHLQFVIIMVIIQI